MRPTVNLSSAFALVVVSLAACAPAPVVTNSVEPACALWEEITPDAWQLAMIAGPDYPKTLGVDFPRWRSLLVKIEANNRKRRGYCAGK